MRLDYTSALAESLQGLGELPVPDVGVLEAALLAETARMRNAELERGVNLVGPHRDDVDAVHYRRHGERPLRA